MSEYGVLSTLVAGVLALAAAGAAIIAAWTRNAQWAPPANDVPDLPARIASVVAAVLIVYLWVNTPRLGAAGLQTWAGNAAITLLLAGLLYTYLMIVYVYKTEKIVDGEALGDRVVGGFWLTPAARAKRAEAGTTQRLLEGAAFQVDALWPRESRALVVLLFVIGFVGVIVSGSTAMAGAALLLDPRGARSTSGPDVAVSTALPLPIELRANARTDLSAADIESIAQAHGLETAALQAFIDVAGDAAGFDERNRPIMYFQPHLFSRLTDGRFDDAHPLISSRQYSPRTRVTADEQWRSLEGAYALEPGKAMLAATWGRYRIMGSQFAECGHLTLGDFLRDVSTSERAQLELAVVMLEQQGLIVRLRNREWAQFATGYFGSGYNDAGANFALAYARATQDEAPDHNLRLERIEGLPNEAAPYD